MSQTVRQKLATAILPAEKYGAIRWHSVQEPHPTSMNELFNEYKHAENLPFYMLDTPLVKTWQDTSWFIYEMYRRVKKTLDIVLVTTDPYLSFNHMREEVNRTGRLRILKTSVTRPHPIWPNHQNNQFRVVHDAFHLVTNMGFDLQGEYCNYLAMCSTLPPICGLVLKTEILAQFVYTQRTQGYVQKCVFLSTPIWS